MKLFKNYLSMHLKTALEYKASFILTLISQGLYMLIELYTVYALFGKFALLETYNQYALLLGFSTMWTSFSFAELIARGFDNFSNLIVNGNFDLLLIRPRNIFIQIIGSDICYEKTFRVLIAFAIFIYSAVNIVDVFTIDKIILLILMLIGCTTIILSLFIIGACISFYTIQGLEAVNIFTNGTKQVGEYPLSIFNKVIRIVFTFIIPIAFVNYYPIMYLDGTTTNFLYVLYPLISIIPFIISLLVFKIGLNKYASSGS